MDINKKMSELLNIRDDNDYCNCSLDVWFNNMIEKKYCELNCDDITKMLNQKIGLEYALLKAIDFLSDDPLCGLYDGHLLNLFLSQNFELLKKIALSSERKMKYILNNPELSDESELKKRFEQLVCRIFSDENCD